MRGSKQVMNKLKGSKVVSRSGNDADLQAETISKPLLCCLAADMTHCAIKNPRGLSTNLKITMEI